MRSASMAEAERPMAVASGRSYNATATSRCLPRQAGLDAITSIVLFLVLPIVIV